MLRPSTAVLLFALLAGCAGERTIPPADSTATAATPGSPEAQLEEARARWAAQPDDVDAIVWYGRRTAYLGRFDEAIAIYTEGLRRHPDEPHLLRHRGHRLLSVRRFAEAEADLARARAVAASLPDEVEPDGLPNAAGIPRSTLKTNILYHLGLAHWYQGEWSEAHEAFARCLAISPNDDMCVAAAYWTVLALHRLGRGGEADEIAAHFAAPDLEILENDDYHALLRLFVDRDQIALDRLAAAEGTAAATLGYGVANWLQVRGHHADALVVLEQVTAAPASSAFGRIAAELDADRWRGVEE